MDLTEETTLLEKKTYYGNTLWSVGSILIKLRGSFKSLPTEEVSLNLDHQILNGGWRSDREGGERARSPEQGRARRTSMEDDEELAGVRGLGPTDQH